jgi:PKD repeat protein
MLFAMIARGLRPTLVRGRLAALALLALVAAACDKVPLTAPTESTITLFASATSIAPNGSTDIVATVIEEGGTPVQNGTVVSFTTTLGRVEPAEARTQNGKVTVRLTGDGRSGVAQVTAFSGGAASEKLELPIGSAAADTVTVRAEPARLGPAGGSATIVALVRDTAGNPLSGASVAFTATAGQLSAGVVATDANGEARTTLTTNRETTVTARVGATSSEVTVSLDLAPSVSLSFSPTAPVANQTVTFTLTVSVPAGGLPIQQARLDFGDGDSRSLGALSSGTTSIAHVYRNDGSYGVVLTVTDSGGNTTTQQTVVVVAPEAPIGVVLSYAPASPLVNEVVTFTATTTLPAGVSIERYEWDFGDGTTSTTTGNQRTKIYTSAGKRKVKVAAVGTNGSTGRGEADIIVQ